MDELPQQVQQWEKENLASFLERFDRIEENERVLLEALNTHVAEVYKELTRDQRSLVAGWALLLLRRRGFTILRRWLKDPGALDLVMVLIDAGKKLGYWP